MASNIDINANFRKNFCSKEINKNADRKLFDTEECTTINIIIDIFTNIFKSKQEEPVESKFTKMWKLRKTNWDKLTPSEKTVCDLNLKWLSPSQFEEKMTEQNSLEADRYKFLNSFNISIPGFDDHNIARLKTELTVYGKVGIDMEGRIVKAKDLDLPDGKDYVVKIFCTLDPDRPLFAKLPDNGEWNLNNGEDTRIWNMKRLYNRAILPDVDNKFEFHNQISFNIQYSEKLEESSSNEISKYEQKNGHKDSVPPEFLVILGHGKRKEYFHLFSLIQGMLSEDAALNPINKDPIPRKILNGIANKIGLSWNDFANIWKRAEDECPHQQNRLQYRFMLFREMIRSESGSSDDCEKRKITMDLMSQRDDWKMFLG